MLRTWNSGQGCGGPIASAIEVARCANKEGRAVRIHSLMRGHTSDEYGRSTSDIVVDVFDIQIPVSTEE